MRKAVIALLFVCVAVGFAADKAQPAPYLAGGPSSAVTAGTQTTMDPRFEPIRAQQAVLRARGDIAGARELERQIQAIQIEKTGRQPAVAPVEVPKPPDFHGSFNPDQQIWGGDPITSYACDYEQDATGTMWVSFGRALDSNVYIYKSIDHGASWQYVNGYFWNPRHVPGKLQMAVGEGVGYDYIYVWELLPTSDGDLMMIRYNHDGTGLVGYGVQAGADTVTDYAAGRDFTGSNYWLYARTYNGLQEPVTNFPVSTRLRCTDDGVTWAVMDTLGNGAHPSFSFGSSYISHLSAVPQPQYFKGYVQTIIDTSYWSPGNWRTVDFHPDTFRINDAAVASDFNTNAYGAVVWLVYSHSWNGTSDYDVLYTYSTDAGVTWATWGYLAGSSSAIEAYVDLKNFTSDGNTYINASYVITGTSSAYLTSAEASAPATWASSALVNQSVPVIWGYAYPWPHIIYSPNGPGNGGGLIFLNSTADGVYFNAPWFTGVAETPAQPKPATGMTVTPSIARGAVSVKWTGNARSLTVTDALGRVVRNYANPAGQSFVWDGKVAAGTYFVRVVTGSGTSTSPVVIQ